MSTQLTTTQLTTAQLSNNVSIWLAEGQSSQRDMLLSLQHLKPKFDFTIIASHRQERPEILNCADIFYQEPKTNPQNRVEFVLEQAIKHQVKVLLTGRNSIDYEAQRETFNKAGIRLLTGARDTDTLAMLEDKNTFINFCQANNIPVASGWRFDNIEQLQDLLNKHQQIPLCVKPITGIFAQGFWRLDTGIKVNWDSFEHLYFTDNKKIHLDEFVHAYANSQLVQEKPIPMLLMPYLAGQEYSIDVVCEQGEILGAVTRYKKDSVQYIGFDTAVMDLVVRLVKAVNADGIISVQTRADSDGNHHVLEINSRPSGGIAYTDHAFCQNQLNLTQLAFAYWAGLIDKPLLADFCQTITPCMVRPLMTSVKIG